MVKNSGTPARTCALRPLNTPRPVSVRISVGGLPIAVRTDNPHVDGIRSPGFTRRTRTRSTGVRKNISSDFEWISVGEVEDLWKINDEWWRGKNEEIERTYYVLILRDDRRLVVFHDMKTREWFLQTD